MTQPTPIDVMLENLRNALPDGERTAGLRLHSHMHAFVDSILDTGLRQARRLASTRDMDGPIGESVCHYIVVGVEKTAPAGAAL